MLGIFVDHHGACEGQHRRAQYHSERRLRIFFLGFHAGVKIIVALKRVVAREHELHALRVAGLNDLLILPHALEPLLKFLLSHQDIESDHEAGLGRIEGDLTFVRRITKILPALWRLIRRYEIRVVGNAMLAPIIRHPPVLLIQKTMKD